MNNDNKLIGFLARNRITGVFVILVAVVIFFTLYSPDNNFIRVANLKNLGVFGSEFGIVALGVGLLMIAGEFDLSVGSVLAFCSLVFTWTNELSIDPFIGLLITLAAGVMTGLINGVITVRGKIVSFVTTLGAMMFWRGLTLMLSRGEMQAVNLDAYPLFTHIFTGEWFGFFPAQAFWFLLLVVILTLVLHSQRFGNWIFSTGDNALAARSMAINTDMVKITCFIIVGFLVAFAAVIQTTRLAAFSSRVGTGWELMAIAAAVVGGTSLRGGIGNMIGIFLGALIIIVIENALVLARLPYEWTFMVFGIVILFSVLLDLFIEKRLQRSAA
jgi:ribose/xylose/arabinose/galactoside ABC-type transport system permease subunit